ncbi:MULTISPECIES: 3-oxo-tetronate kinase [unclassified Herbaspirillum]|uniref:3-oxo-tetronate kinase n=1 Tax=unclassified Herbaspirillum TaxID=2624150 RepID=UPI000E2EDE96|nr:MULTISPECIES: 3-oxo-tetronate kinase [unclassified Herbaspirillum]RFB70989.1 four-carbon acid sugar kinase family protein [Herbaspirillum sp. 3R-3a1]TFI08487.1 four-carbon acid sugar kinase family protein [Herbaspirillum sp. 3R11]TFI14901.1 four-carbon acid sugar kinase family protein [Herbaspirillum sp. 3R-11]TFI25150.1 four-carbon acid sugar kinase family protein [Herbaspirillum sp. 3C11]
MSQAQPLLGCIADDFTGATDLANMLVRGGMRTVQTIGIPDQLPAVAADALVIALKSRTIPAAEAVEQSLAALRWLQQQGCTQFFFKYCSTFDSTDAGNIGQVTDALLKELGVDFTIACPAFPENGRTIYRGYLFVADGLLNESGMENHPLTPMTDANLVRVLQRQTESKVGLVRYDTVAKDAAAVTERFTALRTDGVKMAIADAVSDRDLYVLGEACAELKLVTGGSGIALGLPENFRRAGLLHASAEAAQLPQVDGLSVVLAGSASKATNAQVAEWAAKHPAYRIDPLALARGEAVVAQALAFADEHINKEPVLIYATATPDEVKAVQKELGVAKAGHLVEQALADIAKGLRERGVRRFVVAGGETSGAVVQALDVRALRIGPQIDPGVPATATLDDEPLALALKSGNFGSVDFFEKALRFLGGAKE